MRIVPIPLTYDYVAVYLTDRCPLRCSYCITEHNDTRFISGTPATDRLSPSQWISGLNRLELPEGVPVTLQGGEPLIYPGIWELLERLRHPVDILTALPRNAGVERWRSLSREARERLRRNAPYPNIRVTYHVGQNRIEDLIEQVLQIQEIVSIGIYGIDHPAQKEETRRASELCARAGVLFKTKEFLGRHDGVLYGNYLYPEAVSGDAKPGRVQCKNTVLILGPDGRAYRCHSDLYHKRKELAVGDILDDGFSVQDRYRPCDFFGLCSECDVKIKTNHLQRGGYTSVSIQPLENRMELR